MKRAPLNFCRPVPVKLQDKRSRLIFQKLFRNQSIDFGVKPFKKGLVGIEGAKARVLSSKTRHLHTKPMRNLFHNFQNIPIPIVLRSKTQNIIKK